MTCNKTARKAFDLEHSLGWNPLLEPLGYRALRDPEQPGKPRLPPVFRYVRFQVHGAILAQVLSQSIPMLLADTSAVTDTTRMENREKGAPKGRTITAADKRAAEELRKIWQSAKKEDAKLTQETLAALFGCSQGMISHYMNARTALGPVATLKFARIFGVDPQAIRPDFEFKVVAGDMPQDAITAAVKLASLPSNVRKDFIHLIDVFAKSGYSAYLSNVQSVSNQPRKPGEKADPDLSW